MILTNFMRKNVNRKTKVTKSSGIPPRPHQSPSSSLSAPPEEILDIHEKSDNSRMSEELPPDGDSSVNRPSTSTSRTRLNVGSSLVQLDYNPEPLDNWFPQELLSGRRGSHDSTWSLHMSPPPESAIAEATVLNTAKEDLNPGPTFQEAIIADMSHSRQLSDCVVPFASKKSIPAPIFIPEVEMAPTKVPTRRPTANAESSGTNQQPFPTTSPPSPMDSENMSAISGTTLARALIRNSFILSSSDRGSRYRSGMARQDSATLPSGDRLLMEIALARDSGGDSIVPPVPSLPPGSGVLLLDQARTSAVQDKEQKFPDTTASTMVSPSSGAYYASPDIIMHSGLSRRISRISEVPSPVPTTPMSPQSIRDARPMKSGSSIAASSVLARMDETDSDVPNTASHTPATTSSHRSFHQTGTGVSSTSIQSSEIVSHSPTDGLDGYHFVAPEPSQPTASTRSDVSAYLQTKSSDASLRRRRARALGTTPSLRGGRSFKASDVPSNSIFQRNKKHIRLPIGERPRSIIVPQTPNSPPLIASSTVQCPSALSQFPLVPTSAVPAGHIEMPLTAFAESDILNTSPLSATGIFAQRQHAERTLGISERVTVSQEYDFLDYAINVSPKSQSSPTYPSSSSSTGEQTFPETPNIFTPLFSPNFPVPITALQLPGRPQAPRSATLPIPQEFVGMGALSRAMTLSVAPREEGSVGDNSSPTPWRPLSTVKSTPSPEPDPPEITSEVALVPASSTGQKTRTTDQNIEAAIPLQSSPVDPVICSPFYRVSTSSDKLQGDEVLQALAPNFASSIPSIISQNSFTSTSKSFSLVEKPSLSPTSVPLPGSQNASPSLPYTRSGSISSLTSPSNSPGVKPPFFDPNFQPSGTNLSSPGAQSPNCPQLLSPQPQAAFPRGISSAPDPLSQRPESESHVAGTSFLPSVSPPPPSTPPRSPLPPSFANLSPSLSPSFIAPPSYHSVISNENDMPLATSTSGGASSQETGSETNFIIRPPSISATPSPPSNIRSRTRARPPLPIGPRKPSGPIQPLGSFVPGIRERNGSVSSMGSGYAHGSGSGYAWRKLTAAASTPAPKFQTPPSRWRGMTLEAAQWTLTQHELQTIVSRAIKQSAEASSIRLLRTEMLDVDIPEEVHRLEMQRTDVKTRYKMLVRKRWQLMGTLAGHLDGPDLCDPMTAARTVEELSEVSIALDQLTDELHTTVEQLGQLKSLRDVHSASALAVALRKVNTTFLKQVAESQKLREQIDSMEAERDEAWKQAEDVAQDFDNLSDQVRESRGERVAETAALRLSGRRSARVSAVRKSSIRQSKAGLRSVSKSRSQRSSVSSLGTRTSLMMSMSATSDDIPPVPPLPLHTPLGIITSNLSGRSSLGSTSNTSFSGARALAQAQRELYEMLGLTLQETPSESSSRSRSVSGLLGSRHVSLNPRPMSDIIAIRPRARENRAIHSVLYDDRQVILAQLGMMTN